MKAQKKKALAVYSGFTCSKCQRRIYGALAIMPWTGVICCRNCKRKEIIFSIEGAIRA